MIETFRGKGIYQSAIDLASRKLDDGNWVKNYSLLPLGPCKTDAPVFSTFKRFTSFRKARSSKKSCTT